MRGGIPYAIAKSLAAAPFADILWMETKTADLADATEFADGDPRGVPGQDAGLQPVALVQLGHHRHDRRPDAGVPRGARQDGLRLQLHHLRRSPDRRRRRRGVRHRTAAGRHAGAGPAAAQDAPRRVARTARRRPWSAGRAATPRSPRRRDGRRPPSRWARARRSISTWCRPRCPRSCWRSGWRCGASTTSSARSCACSCGRGAPAARCSNSASTALAMGTAENGEELLANVLVDPIKDRHGRSILTVRDQNTFAEALRQKRLMTLVHLWLVHRFKAEAVYYVTPTEDNVYQTEKMKSPRHLQQRAPGRRRDRRRRREPAAHRRVAGARSRGVDAVDPQGGLSLPPRFDFHRDFIGGAWALITSRAHRGVMIASLIALAGLGAVVVVERQWQRAVNAATAAGLVTRPTGDVTSVP